MTVRALLADATDRLSAAGIDSARVDAELLLAHVLDVPRSRLILDPPVDVFAAARFADLLDRRASREPLQHLTGTAPFRHLELAVGPGVFVPRPETELLVDAVLPALRPGCVVVDLCSGSGALALAIASEVAGVEVWAVERSPDALDWLERNARTSAVRVVPGDVTDETLLSELDATVDVVVSNPPYVPASTAVAPEVHADPAEAVFGGADGLALIPAVIRCAARLLRGGGVLAVEHDDAHGTIVPELLRADGRWTAIIDHRDLSDRPRFATARRLDPHR